VGETFLPGKAATSDFSHPLGGDSFQRLGSPG
jgi:hypothetical protein